MTQEQAPTKAELLADLRASAEQLLAALRPLPPEHFERGVYENGWNGRQILAHVASIEWSYPRLLEVARQSATGAPAETTSEGLATRIAQGGIDSYNARQVAKRAATPVAGLLDGFERNRAALLAAVESVDEALLSAPIRSAGGVTGPVGRVLQAVAVGHVTGHTRDIVGSSQ